MTRVVNARHEDYDVLIVRLVKLLRELNLDELDWTAAANV
jgi:hypothetical protein